MRGCCGTIIGLLVICAIIGAIGKALHLIKDDPTPVQSSTSSDTQDQASAADKASDAAHAETAKHYQDALQSLERSVQSRNDVEDCSDDVAADGTARIKITMKGPMYPV